MTTTSGTTAKDRVLRIIAIFGLIVILLLGAWGIIQIAFALYGFLGNTDSNTSATKQETVLVTAPSSVTSGSPFNLSFTHQNATGNYAYDISYSCAAGLSIQAPLPTGALQNVPCNTPFNYTGATANMALTPTITGSSPISTTFTVAARNLASNKTTASATANTTVVPGTTKSSTTSSISGTTTTKPKPTTTYVPAQRVQTLYGSPDLAVSITTVSGGNGQYSATFTIQNVGTNITPSNWTFNAWLPTSAGYTYTSAPQQALRPGDKIVYTLSFNLGSSYNYTNYQYGSGYYYYPTNCGYTSNYTYNGAYSYPGYNYNCTPQYTNSYNYNTYPYGQYQPTYGGTMTITVDPNNAVWESSEANNTASATLR
ncbi:MAG TPA: hypothetical protein VG984_00310 [Candidatus Paceibacterota bacterium]|nr:hypothetical protein [Candidatus Paceibacterota bacterium]